MNKMIWYKPQTIKEQLLIYLFNRASKNHKKRWIKLRENSEQFGMTWT